MQDGRGEESGRSELPVLCYTVVVVLSVLLLQAWGKRGRHSERAGESEGGGGGERHHSSIDTPSNTQLPPPPPPPLSPFLAYVLSYGR